MPPGSDDTYLFARRQTTTSSIFDTSGGLSSGEVAGIRSSLAASATWNTYFWVDSADETAARVVAAGGDIASEPFEFLDAARVATFADPEGAAFSVWEAREHKGARLVNDPGVLVFNGLNTHDVEGPRSFYGSVFGWRTLAIGGGGEGWALPGYGDHLERYQPDLRARLAGAGAPAGFEEVVGSINPLADDQRDTPAYWSVTFAVDDADAAAAKATELGGTVVVPPFDAPWSTATYAIRLTVIADPQGATFGASKFAPTT